MPAVVTAVRTVLAKSVEIRALTAEEDPALAPKQSPALARTRAEAAEICVLAEQATVRGPAARRAQVVRPRVDALAAPPSRPSLPRCCIVSGTSAICRKVVRWSATGCAWLSTPRSRTAVVASR